MNCRNSTITTDTKRSQKLLCFLKVVCRFAVLHGFIITEDVVKISGILRCEITDTGAGLTADFGLSNGTDETASFQRAVIRNSRKRYLLIPNAKVGVNSFIKVCEAEVFDAIITDWDCVEDQIAALEDKGIQVIVVEEPNE